MVATGKECGEKSSCNTLDLVMITERIQATYGWCMESLIDPSQHALKSNSCGCDSAGKLSFFPCVSTSIISLEGLGWQQDRLHAQTVSQELARMCMLPAEHGSGSER